MLRKTLRLEQGYNSLEQQMARSNFSQLYLSIKKLLCCTLANRVRIAWIAWICAAATAGAVTPSEPLRHDLIAPARLVLRPTDCNSIMHALSPSRCLASANTNIHHAI